METYICFCGSRVDSTPGFVFGIEYKCPNCGFKFSLRDLTSGNPKETLKRLYIEFKRNQIDPMNALPEHYRK